MLKTIVKDAFDEGRDIGGEWEDSDAKIVSDMLQVFDIESIKIRQRKTDGKFGKTFTNIKAVEKFFETASIPFHKTNFVTALYSGWKCGGFYWEVCK